MPRYQTFPIRLTAAERATLDRTAKHYGKSRAELVRWLVNLADRQSTQIKETHPKKTGAE